MIFTAAIAVICAGARALEESPNLFSCSYSSGHCVSLVVGLVSLWAVLGDARPLRRSPVVFVLSPVLGACFAFAADAHSGWVDLHPPDHAAVPGGLTGVSACCAVVRLPDCTEGLCPPQVRCDLLGRAISGPVHLKALTKLV